MKIRSYEKCLKKYLDHLEQEERSETTKSQYRREILRFLSYLGTKDMTKENAVAYKLELEKLYRPASVNTKLSAINSFLSFIGKKDMCLKLLKIQRRVYCSAEKELSKGEYLRLVKAAEDQKNERLALLLQTICSTGIRVSEIRYVTSEAVQCGEAVIRLKGKTRVVLLPKMLRKRLKRYVQQEQIDSGPVFITRAGRPLDRSNIWKMMKGLCRSAGVDAKKVFPHNLRHLFARCFYALDRDIAKLADILGHSSINTTRIYIITSGREHRRCLDTLGLVVWPSKEQKNHADIVC